MKSYSVAGSCAALALALVLSSVPARAQAPVIAAPIIVKTIDAVTSKPNTTAKGEWLKGEVIHADAESIIVAEQANERMIHTFTVSPTLKDHMQAIVDRGGYQYGDKVKILHQPGQTVALKVSGKPSKPN
jgi:ribosomal protein L18